jgi:hypothetical protein
MGINLVAFFEQVLALQDFMTSPTALEGKEIKMKMKMPAYRR